MLPTTAESEAAAHLSPPPAVVPGGGNEACEAVFDDSSSGTESGSRGAKRPRRQRGVSWEEKRARVLAAVPPGFLEPLPPRRSVTKQLWKAGYYDGKGQLLWSDHAQHSAYTVGVHALWSSSSTQIFWRLKPIERTSQWVHWLEACVRMGTHPIALMLPEAKEVNSQEGEGEFHLGQSSQSSDAGGSSFQSGQSSHAAGGHDVSAEVDSEEEEEEHIQNMMDEEDEDGVEDELDSDGSGGSDNSDDNEEEDPIPSSWNHDLSEAMIVDDRHDSAWEYSMNTISIGARYADKRHLQEAITQWAMNTQRNQECKYTFLRGKLDEFTKDHVRQRKAARAALAVAHAAAMAQAHLEAEPQNLEPLQTRTPKNNWMIHPEWEDRLKWAGLLPFARLVEARDHVSRLNYDAALITCLVDRWRPETHTFHFRWGEMAPTLEDVSMLLGLPLAGEPIGPLEETVGWMRSMDARFLGIRDDVGPISFEAHGPRQAWLHEFQIEQFGYPDESMTASQITRSLEAYLMWLLGKTMFTDNHGNTISARYIPIAQEIAEATEAEHITQRS
ncbi:hypothetical protein QYE76_031530 [Lolium multiflorum]|uniref:Aminotransferase-like plant mobile domain-containing protein n=1 Tax=Lolium multiflorum TaxID=4521 RepID=A0AAD8QU76_LOLMU|nr:hypothetical protein QYE76_031530 [Lolium multiflorum]